MFKNRRRFPKKKSSDNQLNFLRLSKSDNSYSVGSNANSHNSNLSNFDACVEACDSIAAASSTSDASKELSGSEDCSVLVSPDGNMLSSLSSPRQISLKEKNSVAKEEQDANGDIDPGNEENKFHFSLLENGNNEILTERSIQTGEIQAADPSDLADNVVDFAPKNSLDTQSLNSNALIDEENEEYLSAIHIGIDTVQDGEKLKNGFSARGWNPIMATLAMRKSVDTMMETAGFVEELILSRKNSVAASSQACEKLRDMMTIEGVEHLSPSTPDDLKNITQSSSYDNTNNNGVRDNPLSSRSVDGELRARSPRIESPISTSRRTFTPGQKSSTGPLMFPGGSLRRSMIALEKYHSAMAQGDALRLRMASAKGGAMSNNGLVGGVLHEIHEAANKAKRRCECRENALNDSNESMAEAEAMLRTKKDQSRILWAKVERMENNIRFKVEEMVRQRSRERELKRRAEEDEKRAALSGAPQFSVTNQEIWELVASIGENGEDFAPSDLPAVNFHGPIDQTLSKSKSFDEPSESENKVHSPQVLAEIDMYTATLETEFGLEFLRQQAMESDDQVQDAAGALLNVISASDTTARSARIATETSLLSSSNAQVKCLKSLVKLERDSIKERLELIEKLEKAVNDIDVRSDLDRFIEHEKCNLPNGLSKNSDLDDGGTASALAVLNSHSEGIGVGIGVKGVAELSSFTSWNEDKVYDREELEDAVRLLFDTSTPLQDFNEAVDLLVKAVGEQSIKARGYRASTCYAMNNHRGKVTQLTQQQFVGLCKVLKSLLNGCDRESADVASVKMVMMLSQTFYTLKEEDATGNDRSKRIYPKSEVSYHPIWHDEDFWVQALFQCVTDSLSNSGVMVRVKVRKTAALKNGKMKWHDLRPSDRADAASQVHSVIFAQLGALAHSMVEFGCSVDMACSFVRRLSVRHQLPLSQRTMLLSHLRRSEI